MSKVTLKGLGRQEYIYCATLVFPLTIEERPDRDNMKMQMLLVLAVAVLMIPSLSEGRILSKCELKSLLEEAAFKFNLTEKARENYVTNKDFVAKSKLHYITQ